MEINDILAETGHRPWEMPSGKWRYYQEWNEAIFLHWQVNVGDLQKFVPRELRIDVYEEKPWVSIVAFNMERIRPKSLPAFPPVSNFYELNIRTYVEHNGKPGVYFLSIEGSKKTSCKLAKQLSGLPYRYSAIHRNNNRFVSKNDQFNDKFEIDYDITNKVNEKPPLDTWLLERYALFQNTSDALTSFDIHHLPWVVNNISINNIDIRYPRFDDLLDNQPDQSHYSLGAKVVAWSKNRIGGNPNFEE